MPKLFRTMKKDGDGKPVVDATGKGLGVRGIPVNNVVDVDLDEEGRVILNDKGMSVAPDWRVLPPHLIPRRLRDQFPEAIGSPQLHCFVMGDGPFQDGPMAEGLELKRDSPRHGVVSPQSLVMLDQYQKDLAATRGLWIVDEG
jgi:hypothetical protein